MESQQSLSASIAMHRIAPLLRPQLQLLRAIVDPNISREQRNHLLRYNPVVFSQLMASQAAAEGGVSSLHSLIDVEDESLEMILTSSRHQWGRLLGESVQVALYCQWRHALVSAHLGRGLARLMEYPDAEEVYWLGLVHDYIGKACMGDSSIRGELQSSQVRALWLKNSGLPDHYVDAIRYYKKDTAELHDAHPLVRVLHVAVQLSDESSPLSDDASALVSFASLLESPRDHLSALKVAAQRYAQDISQALGFRVRTKSYLADAKQCLGLSRNLVNQITQLKGLQALPGSGAHIEEVQHYVAMMLAQWLPVSLCGFFKIDQQRLMGCQQLPYAKSINDLTFPVSTNNGHSFVLRCSSRERGVFVTTDYNVWTPTVADRQMLHLLRAKHLLVLNGCHRTSHCITVVGLRASTALPRLQLDALTDVMAKALYEAEARQRELEKNEARVRHLERLRLKRLVKELSEPLGVAQNKLSVLSEQVKQEAVSVERSESVDTVRVLSSLEPLFSRVNRALKRSIDEEHEATPGQTSRSLLQSIIDQYRDQMPAKVFVQAQLEPLIRNLQCSDSEFYQILSTILKLTVIKPLPFDQVTVSTRADVMINRGSCFELNIRLAFDEVYRERLVATSTFWRERWAIVLEAVARCNGVVSLRRVANDIDCSVLWPYAD